MAAKIDFFASLDSVRIRLSENEGVQIFPPPFFWGGVISVLASLERIMYLFQPFLANFSNERVVLWVLKCHEFIYATFKSTRSVLNRLPVHRVASRRGMSFVST